MTEILLNECIKKYNEAVRNSGNTEKYGIPPSSIIIFHVNGKKINSEYRVTEKLCAWRYSDENISEIPVDEKPKTEPISGMYYPEAYAEFGYDNFCNKAFINTFFGKRYARGFEYDVIREEEKYRIDKETVLWVS